MGNHFGFFFHLGGPGYTGYRLGEHLALHAGVAGGVGFVPVRSFDERPCFGRALHFAFGSGLGPFRIGTRSFVTLSLAVHIGALGDSNRGVRNFLDNLFAFIAAGCVGHFFHALIHIYLAYFAGNFLDGTDGHFATNRIGNFFRHNLANHAGYRNAFANGAAAKDSATAGFGFDGFGNFATLGPSGPLKSFTRVTGHNRVGFGYPFQLFAHPGLTGGDRFTNRFAHGAGTGFRFSFPLAARNLLYGVFDFHAPHTVPNLLCVVFDDRFANVVDHLAGMLLANFLAHLAGLGVGLGFCYGLANGIADGLFTLDGDLATHIVFDLPLGRLDLGTAPGFGFFTDAGFFHRTGNGVFLIECFGVVTGFEDRFFDRAHDGFAARFVDRFDLVLVAGFANGFA